MIETIIDSLGGGKGIAAIVLSVSASVSTCSYKVIEKDNQLQTEQSNCQSQVAAVAKANQDAILELQERLK